MTRSHGKNMEMITGVMATNGMSAGTSGRINVRTSARINTKMTIIKMNTKMNIMGNDS